MNKISQTLISTISDSLANEAYIILEEALPVELVNSLHKRVLSLGSLSKAMVGRGSERQSLKDIRSDKTLWIEGEEESEQVYLTWMESLREAMNKELYMGLSEYEAHFSHYEEGSFYQKHFDVLKGSNKRLLTTVFYLTSNWKEGDGGELLIYDEDGKTVLKKVAPKMGTIVIFLSDKFAHEVLPSNKDRYSIAGWFKGV